jgi:transposase
MPRRPKPRQDDTKTAALRASGTLHPHPEALHEQAFSGHEFFDRRDRVQVKYEMLRSHRVDGQSVTEVADTFGVSRQAFYTAERGFQAQGIAGLLPRPLGPKRAHKCTDEILDFVEQWSAEAHDSQETAAQAVAGRFGVSIHPRSLDRALARRKKKRRTPPREVSR